MRSITQRPKIWYVIVPIMALLYVAELLYILLMTWASSPASGGGAKAVVHHSGSSMETVVLWIFIGAFGVMSLALAFFLMRDLVRQITLFFRKP